MTADPLLLKIGSAAAVAAVVLLFAAFARGGRGAGSAPGTRPAPAEDTRVVAALDEEYQQAVKRNDADTMARILADDFVLVTGRGATYDKADLLREAREGTTRYERQDVETREVRVWGDTAVVTARLWIKGVRGGEPIDYRLWYSDTYVRTAKGWRYALGQASLRLPPGEPVAPVR
jgi:uncharacterized protein (TIGR02246 family)